MRHTGRADGGQLQQQHGAGVLLRRVGDAREHPRRRRGQQAQRREGTVVVWHHRGRRGRVHELLVRRVGERLQHAAPAAVEHGLGSQRRVSGLQVLDAVLQHAVHEACNLLGGGCGAGGRGRQLLGSRLRQHAAEARQRRGARRGRPACDGGLGRRRDTEGADGQELERRGDGGLQRGAAAEPLRRAADCAGVSHADGGPQGVHIEHEVGAEVDPPLVVARDDGDRGVHTGGTSGLLQLLSQRHVATHARAVEREEGDVFVELDANADGVADTPPLVHHPRVRIGGAISQVRLGRVAHVEEAEGLWHNTNHPLSSVRWEVAEGGEANTAAGQVALPEALDTVLEVRYVDREGWAGRVACCRVAGGYITERRQRIRHRAGTTIHEATGADDVAVSHGDVVEGFDSQPTHSVGNDMLGTPGRLLRVCLVPRLLGVRLHALAFTSAHVAGAAGGGVVVVVAVTTAVHHELRQRCEDVGGHQELGILHTERQGQHAQRQHLAVHVGAAASVQQRQQLREQAVEGHPRPLHQLRRACLQVVQEVPEVVLVVLLL